VSLPHTCWATRSKRHCKGLFPRRNLRLYDGKCCSVEQVVSKGSGNEIDMEQLLLWDPEVVVFAHDSIYDTVKDSPEWQKFPPLKKANMQKSPRPARLALVSALSAEIPRLHMACRASVSRRERTRLQTGGQRLLQAFYGYDLSDEELDGLTKDSFFKAP